MSNPFTRGNRSFGTVLLGKFTPQEERQPIEIDTYHMDIDHYNKTGEIRKIEQTIEPNEPELQNADHNAQPNKMVETEEKEVAPKLAKKPTAEELRADQLTMNKLQSAKKYGVTKSTVERWTREYELPHWKQTWEWHAETQNGAVLPSEGSPMMDSSSEEIPSDSEPNTGVQEVARLETMPAEPEGLEGLCALDDIPFGEPPSSEEEKQIVEEAEGVEPKTEWDYSTPHSQNEMARRFVEELRDAKFKLENPTVYQAEAAESEYQGFPSVDKIEVSTEKVKAILDEAKGIDGHLSVPDDSDEDIWQHIENHVQALYSIKLNRLNGEFKGRLRKLMDGIAG